MNLLLLLITWSFYSAALIAAFFYIYFTMQEIKLKRLRKYFDNFIL